MEPIEVPSPNKATTLSVEVVLGVPTTDTGLDGETVNDDTNVEPLDTVTAKGGDVAVLNVAVTLTDPGALPSRTIEELDSSAATEVFEDKYVTVTVLAEFVFKYAVVVNCITSRVGAKSVINLYRSTDRVLELQYLQPLVDVRTMDSRNCGLGHSSRSVRDTGNL